MDMSFKHSQQVPHCKLNRAARNRMKHRGFSFTKNFPNLEETWRFWPLSGQLPRKQFAYLAASRYGNVVKQKTLRQHGNHGAKSESQLPSNCFLFCKSFTVWYTPKNKVRNVRCKFWTNFLCRVAVIHSFLLDSIKVKSNQQHRSVALIRDFMDRRIWDLREWTNLACAECWSDLARASKLNYFTVCNPLQCETFWSEFWNICHVLCLWPANNTPHLKETCFCQDTLLSWTLLLLNLLLSAIIVGYCGPKTNTFPK